MQYGQDKCWNKRNSYSTMYMWLVCMYMYSSSLLPLSLSSPSLPHSLPILPLSLPPPSLPQYAPSRGPHPPPGHDLLAAETLPGWTKVHPLLGNTNILPRCTGHQHSKSSHAMHVHVHVHVLYMWISMYSREQCFDEAVPFDYESNN